MTETGRPQASVDVTPNRATTVPMQPADWRTRVGWEISGGHAGVAVGTLTGGVVRLHDCYPIFGSAAPASVVKNHKTRLATAV